jgi:hypothetical protein
MLVRGGILTRYFVKPDGDLTFVPKGELAKIKRGDMGVMFGVNLGSNGIRINAYWD